MRPRHCSLVALTTLSAPPRQALAFRPLRPLHSLTLLPSLHQKRNLSPSVYYPHGVVSVSSPQSIVAALSSAESQSRRMVSSAAASASTASIGKATTQKPIYLDHNGTTPIYPAVLSAMMPYLTEEFGNPSSGHAYGTKPKEAVALARRQLMWLLDSDVDACDAVAEEAIVFTGCGTEADNLAIQLAILSSPSSERGEKKHVVTCAIEHPAILECLKILEKRGEIDLTVVPVDTEGIVSAEDIAQAIKPGQTVLVTIMTVNNEVGSVQPVSEISRYCKYQGVLFHTDAAQAVGKVSVELKDLGHPDMITVVGHKMGAPKGIAALYIRPGCLCESGRTIPDGYGSCGTALIGGGQERGRRAGTENVPYIAGMGAAAELLTRPSVDSAEQPQWRSNAARMERLRSRLLENLRKSLGDDNVRPNGPVDGTKRSPSTLSVGLRNVQSGELLRNISDLVAASAGSACHASGGGISEVLKALNVPEPFARGTLRLSFGPSTTVEEVDEATDIIVKEARRQLSV